MSANPAKLAHVETTSVKGGEVLVARPKAGARLPAFVSGERPIIEQLLLEHGAVLFRGWGVDTPEAFREVVDAMEAETLKYVYRSTPRTEIAAGIYTATEYPPRATIPLHCENAYSRDWPLKLFFCCVTAAQEGGETHLARIARVTAAIPEQVKARFQQKGVMYVRNYGSGADLPWETVFQTTVKEEVERFCREHAIDYEWTAQGLRTKQVCQAMARHRRTGELLWFNQAHLFHPSALEEPVRQALEVLFKPEDLPRNAFYGDGTELEPDVLATIRAAFDGATFEFPWEHGDVLFVDNMLVAHGRRPFKGPRKVLVAMSEPYSSNADELPSAEQR
jgi:alpha-ketoglutarate-dependent taurine dioxygenase